jgi:hypothetical protein
MKFDEAFPAPPGLDAAREILLKRQQERDKREQEEQKRDPFTRVS